MMNLETLKSDEVNVSEGERWLSLIGGTVLTIFGLGKKSLGGLLFALAGGYLIYRGARGHCYLYELLGISPDPYATMLPPESTPPPSIDQGDEVLESSWESFPTSDAPSWTMGREGSDNGN